METNPEVFLEGNEKHVLIKEEEQKVSQNSGTCLEDNKHAMSEAIFSLNPVLVADCTTESLPDELPVVQGNNTSMENDKDENASDQAEELSSGERTFQVLDKEIDPISDGSGRKNSSSELIGNTENACHPLSSFQENYIHRNPGGEKVECQHVSISNRTNDTVCSNPEFGMGSESFVTSATAIGSDDFSHFAVEKYGVDEHGDRGSLHTSADFAKSILEDAESVNVDVVINLKRFSNNLHSAHGTVSQIGESSAVITITEPEEAQDHVVDHKTSSETIDLASHELCSTSSKRIDNDDDGFEIAVVDDIEVMKAFPKDHLTEPVECSPISVGQCGSETIEKSGNNSEEPIQCTSVSRNENSLGQGCLINNDVTVENLITDRCVEPSVGVLQDRDIHTSQEQDLKGVNEDVHEEYHTDSGNVDNSCLMASAEVMPSRCDAKTMEADERSSNSDLGNTDARSCVVGKQLCQSTEDSASSECQHNGYVSDKDGGSSLDSTAGTRLDPSNECKPAEEEEGIDKGSENIADNVQCLAQQRKKIDVHHQFVREIVKIQHEREQYDRAQAEKQTLAQRTASSSQIGWNISSAREQSSCEGKDIIDDSQTEEKSMKNMAPYKQKKDLDQMQLTKIKKYLPIQSESVSSHHLITPKQSSKQVPCFLSQSIGAKEGTSSQVKQQRPISIYRPPVARESLSVEQRDLGKTHITSNQCSSHKTNNLLVNSGGPYRQIQATNSCSGMWKHSSSAEECYADSSEIGADVSSGLSIKVTFDTEKCQRRIHLSDNQHILPRNEKSGFMPSHNKSGVKFSRGEKVIASSNSFAQDLKTSPVNGQEPDHGELFARGTGRQSYQVMRSNLPHNGSSTESPIYHEKAGKSFDKVMEKNSFEQYENAANMQTSSWFQKSPRMLVHHGNDDTSFRNTPNNGYLPSSQNFNIASFQGTTFWPHSPKDNPISVVSEFVGIQASKETSVDLQNNLVPQQQQHTISRPHKLRVSQRHSLLKDKGKGKRDFQHKSSIEDIDSPFQAILRGASRSQPSVENSMPQTVSLSPAEKSADADPACKGSSMDWHAKDKPHMQETFRLGLISSQSTVSRRGQSLSVQAQPMASSLGGSLLPPCMQEKWGDIVDDQTDSSDHLQNNGDSKKKIPLHKLPYGGSNDSKQERVLNRYEGISSMQKHVGPLREYSTAEAPARKCTFERLCAPNNFQESILGPPPKVLDSRGVNKNFHSDTYNNADSISHRLQQSYQFSAMKHEKSDNSSTGGQRVVVQAYAEVKKRRSKHELYVPRRGS